MEQTLTCNSTHQNIEFSSKNECSKTYVKALEGPWCWNKYDEVETKEWRTCYKRTFNEKKYNDFSKERPATVMCSAKGWIAERCGIHQSNRTLLWLRSQVWQWVHVPIQGELNITEIYTYSQQSTILLYPTCISFENRL